MSYVFYALYCTIWYWLCMYTPISCPSKKPFCVFVHIYVTPYPAMALAPRPKVAASRHFYCVFHAMLLLLLYFLTHIKCFDVKNRRKNCKIAKSCCKIAKGCTYYLPIQTFKVLHIYPTPSRHLHIPLFEYDQYIMNGYD